MMTLHWKASKPVLIIAAVAEEVCSSKPDERGGSSDQDPCRLLWIIESNAGKDKSNVETKGLQLTNANCDQ